MVDVLYFSAHSVVFTYGVLNVAKALSTQISDSKIASNCPHPLDLCARFVNSLVPDVSGRSVSHTPNMKRYIWVKSTYQPASAVKKLRLESKTKSPRKQKRTWMSL